MMSSFSKRVTVRIISFSAAAALLLAGAGMGGYKLISRYRDSSEYRYQLALNNLSDYVSNIKTSVMMLGVIDAMSPRTSIVSCKGKFHFSFSSHFDFHKPMRRSRSSCHFYRQEIPSIKWRGATSLGKGCRP